jgi:hypothetical protein
MTDKQIQITAAVITAVAAMIPGFLLFWVEYRRDRERIRVRRVITYTGSYANQPEWWISIALEVTNLSPFAITLTAAGYNVGSKEQYWGLPSTRHRYFDLATGDIPFLAAAKLLPEYVTKETSEGFLTTDVESIRWPLQVLARTKVWIYAGEEDVKGMDINRTLCDQLTPPSLPPKFRVFVKPSTGSSLYAQERNFVSRQLVAMHALLKPLRNAISEMRQEE